MRCPSHAVWLHVVLRASKHKLWHVDIDSNVRRSTFHNLCVCMYTWFVCLWYFLFKLTANKLEIIWVEFIPSLSVCLKLTWGQSKCFTNSPTQTKKCYLAWVILPPGRWDIFSLRWRAADSQVQVRTGSPVRKLISNLVDCRALSMLSAQHSYE